MSSIGANSAVVVPVWLKKGTMTFPPDKPLIMVGPGTGVAAFRAVIQQFKATGQQLILIFGCRSQEADFYYEQEWRDLQAQGVNLQIITAFSRENEEEGKVYVQHKIRENGPFLAELILSKDACIYVSGRAKFMPKSVEKAFAEIIKQQTES